MTEDDLSLEEIRIVYPQYPTGTRVLDELFRTQALRIKEFYTKQEG